MSITVDSSKVTIGVLALQGAFIEHLTTLRRLGVVPIEVRSINDLSQCDGLIIPGGESTTMALIAQRERLLSPLQQWTQQQRPMFGTCAGLIMMADEVERQKIGGQELIGGLNITVDRNHYGSQLGSFQTNINIHNNKNNSNNGTSPAVFIRAPGIIRVGKDVSVLASLPKSQEIVAQQQGMTNRDQQQSAISDNEELPVAVRQGYLLGTTFHPELTTETHWHQLFIDMVREYKNQQDQHQEPHAQNKEK